MVSMQHDTSDVIVEGAMRALARHGTSRLSMTDIYRESQVSRGTLYRYFANREAVLDAVNTQIMSSMRATFDQAVAEHPDPVRSSRAGHRFATHPGRRSTGRPAGPPRPAPHRRRRQGRTPTTATCTAPQPAPIDPRALVLDRDRQTRHPLAPG